MATREQDTDRAAHGVADHIHRLARPFAQPGGDMIGLVLKRPRLGRPLAMNAVADQVGSENAGIAKGGDDSRRAQRAEQPVDEEDGRHGWPFLA